MIRLPLSFERITMFKNKADFGFHSGYRFPYNFTRTYLRPYTYIGFLKTVYHRARYGWSERDTWSADHYLAGVIADILRAFIRDERCSTEWFSVPCFETDEELKQYNDDLVFAADYFQKYHESYDWLFGEEAQQDERDRIRAFEIVALCFPSLWT